MARSKKDDPAVVLAFVFGRARADLSAALAAWVDSGAADDVSFGGWKAVWAARELSMLHHAPYRLSALEKLDRRDFTQALYAAAASIWDPTQAADGDAAFKWRCGVAYALYSLHETQPEPVEHIVSAARRRCAAAGVAGAAATGGARDWRVRVAVSPAFCAALLDLRAAALEPARAPRDGDDVVQVLRRLAENIEYAADEAGVPRAPRAAPRAAPAAPGGGEAWSTQSIGIPGIRADCRAYNEALQAAGCGENPRAAALADELHHLDEVYHGRTAASVRRRPEPPPPGARPEQQTAQPKKRLTGREQLLASLTDLGQDDDRLPMWHEPTRPEARALKRTRVEAVVDNDAVDESAYAPEDAADDDAGGPREAEDDPLAELRALLEDAAPRRAPPPAGMRWRIRHDTDDKGNADDDADAARDSDDDPLAELRALIDDDAPPAQRPPATRRRRPQKGPPKKARPGALLLPCSLQTIAPRSAPTTPPSTDPVATPEMLELERLLDWDV
ncbi:hypothetical protein M885DRAFT_511045 [Pelagophyceae sp. CCMP2097]|nr:hypothetical protein M885DRAFT_511045 [Pelagophyceae sp. CCMP2097]